MVRAEWDLTAERVAKSPGRLDVPALLARIEAEMADTKPEVQWTMNNTLATIGIHFPKHRNGAIAIGEKLIKWIQVGAKGDVATLRNGIVPIDSLVSRKAERTLARERR